MIKDSYRILKVLGMGSYGITYLCENQTSQHLCVLKQVKPSKRKGKKGLPVFEREREALKSLDHPCIPKWLDDFEFCGDIFLAMEYINGPNMEDYIFDSGAQFSEQESLQILAKLLDIVAYVHGHGLIHRDLRLPNVLVCGDKLHLIDFGLSRKLGEPATYEAEDIREYAIGKQLKREVHFKSDFYAMGHFLLFLLYTTYKPDKQKTGSWEEELDISSPTRTLIRKMLQLDEPYSHAEELREGLHQAIRHISGSNYGKTMCTP